MRRGGERPTGRSTAPPLFWTLGIAAPRGPVLVGHRGLPAHHPENSLAAFEAAWNAGAPMVELDVCESADGVLVVMHDETVDRTTDGTGRIDAMTWDQIRALTLANGEPPPRLEQVLERLGPGRWVNVELKAIRDPVRAARALDRNASAQRVVLSSFDWDGLSRVQRELDGWPAALLADRPVLNPAQTVLERGAQGLHPDRSIVTREMVDELHAQGLWIIIWTVDDPQEARRFSIWGADGLVTNDVERLSGVLPSGKQVRATGAHPRRARKPASRA